MVDNISRSNETIHALRRLSNRYDSVGDQMQDFLRREHEGANPDPNEFAQLLHQRANMQDAMRAQFRLYEKPLKTVLNETK